MPAETKIGKTQWLFRPSLAPSDTKIIFVEDRLGAEIVKKALRTLGDAAFNQFEIKPYPGGAKTIFSKLMPSLMQSGNDKCIFLLDGDQKPKMEVVDPKEIPQTDHDSILEGIKNFTGLSVIGFAENGGNDTDLINKRKALERDFLEFAINYTSYLPSDNPEIFIWDNMTDDNLKNKCNNTDEKERFVALTRLEKGRLQSELISADEILETQTRRLASIDNTHPEIVNLATLLRNFVG